MYIQTVTQKGQFTIPKKFRDELNIKTLGKVRLEKGIDHIKVYPDNGPSIFELAGTFKVTKGTNVVDAREFMENNYERV